MKFNEEIDSNEIISVFCRDKVRKRGNLVAEKIVYVVDLYLGEFPPLNLYSIKRIRLQRRWLPSSESFNKSVWYFGTQRVTLEGKHFEPVNFSLHKDDKGHSLSVLALLALKRKLDSVTRHSVDGLLFRSELLRLVDMETWQGRDPELDRILSGMKRYTTTGKEKSRYYSNHPLRDRFLLADNEIYNLVCWAGSGKPCTSGRCLEKAWVINIEPEHIRIYDPDDVEVKEQRLRTYLDFIFPRHLVLLETELKRYRDMLEKGEKPWFEIGKREGIVRGAWLGDSIGGPVRSEYRKPTSEKLLDIVDFSEVFRKCESAGFVGRVGLLAALDELVDDCTKIDPFLLIVGEAGIGKTALMAKWITERKDGVAWYFCEERKRHRLDAKTFTRHLLASLGWIHGLGEIRLDGDLGTLIELLNKAIAELCGRNDRVVIVVDALDESLSVRDEGLTIVDVLQALDHVEGLRVVMSSREMPELNRFSTVDRRNVILMTGDDPENQKDIEAYYKAHFGLKRSSKRDLKILLERTDGNFLYAALCVEMVKHGEANIGWLLKNAPKGLTELYEWKLDIIRQGTRDKNMLEQMWLVMRTISLMRVNLTPKQLSAILSIDPLLFPSLLGPLQQFLDLDQFSKKGRCNWFHKSFSDFVMGSERLAEHEIRSVYSRVVDWGKRLVKLRSGPIIYGIVPGKLLSMYARIADAGEVLDYAKQVYLPSLMTIRSISSVPKELITEVLFAVGIAKKSRRLEDVVFFLLLAWALDTFNANGLEMILRKRKGLEVEWESQTRDLARRLEAGDDPIRRMTMSVKANFSGTVSDEQLFVLFRSSYLELQDEFDGWERILDVCCKYARVCATDLARDTDPSMQ